MYILIAEEVPLFFREALSDLGYDVDYHADTIYEELRRIIESYHGLVVRSNLSIDQAVISNGSNLKFIMRPGSGLDNIDLEAAHSAGIQVISSPEGNRNAVGEHALGMLLSFYNNITPSFEGIKKSFWQREVNRGHEVDGKTIGIIGYGNTGSAFAHKLKGFNANVLVYDKYRTYIESSNPNLTFSTYENILEFADVISFHLPLNQDTSHYANHQFFSQLGKAPLIINTSRGKIVDQQALLDALNNNKISGACLDVLENENLANYSDIEKKWLDDVLATKKILITPHIAGWSYESGTKIYEELIKKLKEARLK